MLNTGKKEEKTNTKSNIVNEIVVYVYNSIEESPYPLSAKSLLEYWLKIKHEKNCIFSIIERKVKNINR